MRLLTLLTVLGIMLATAADARPSREVKVERQSSGRNYQTPAVSFENDLRRGWLPREECSTAYGYHDWQHYNRLYPCYRQRPGLRIRYDDGNWSAELNTGYGSRFSRGNFRSDYYLYGHGYLSDNWHGNRSVYVYGDTRGLERRVVTPRRRSDPLYTAPVYPDYGFYPQHEAASYPAQQVYHDNRVYNNFYGDSANAEAVSAIPPASSISPSAAPARPASTQRAFGQRFSETLKLDTPDGIYMFAIRDTAIFAGLADGKATRLSDTVDAAFGGYSAWLPGSGICLFYRVGDQLCLAYPSGSDERWVHEPLPYAVRFGTDTSIGLVGGLPWLTFSTSSGNRYVVRFNGQSWEELGSASR
jgi:hypothetical protein